MPVGKAQNNLLLDTKVYTIRYTDGHEAAMMGNQIAKNLFAQVNDNGYQYVLMDEIIDHRFDESAIGDNNRYFITSTGTRL